MATMEATKAVWSWPEYSVEVVARLQKELGLSGLLAQALVARGLSEPADVEKFLNPSIDHFHDPHLLPDYDEAAKAILGAKERGELIYVHGDYDVDGVTSTALFTRFLTRIGCRVAPHVPHRIREGYGIHLDAVQWAKEQGASLFLTCDCGVKAHEQIEAVCQAGMTAVVTDHHAIGETLPGASAVVNPHRKDSPYPFAELSGVGVVFKLCAGLTQDLGLKVENYYRAYLDLAVLGTVADVMPLVGENRTITALGLPQLLATKKLGLQALMRVSQLEAATRLTSRDIGYRLGPRINAVGRIDDPSVALELMLTDDMSAATNAAQFLDMVNTQRREEQAKALEEAVQQVIDRGIQDHNVIFVWAGDWHPGLVGIVAGKLVEKFGRPAFVASVNSEGIAKASARSIPGFDLGEALDAHRHMILGGGGHAAAAGMSANADCLDELHQAMHEYAAGVLPPDAFVPKLNVEVEAGLDFLNLRGLRELERLEPFGNSNPEPLIGVRNVILQDWTPTTKPEHVRLKLSDGKTSVQAMGFGMGEEVARYLRGSRVDVAVKLSENVYNERVSATVSVQAMRMA
jgi:single-stranded-DNA-specific exonuclease